MKKEKARILITCGPTRERIDLVRFISNLSTGAFGIEIARQYAKAGHPVTLVHGPIPVPKDLGLNTIAFTTTTDLLQILKKEMTTHDVLFMAAAVSDFRVKKIINKKLHRNKKTLSLTLERTEDVLESIGELKGDKTYVGFCIESENVRKNALRKLKQKNLDWIVAHSVSTSQQPFGDKRIDCWIIDKQGSQKSYKNCSKEQLARILKSNVVLPENEPSVQS